VAEDLTGYAPGSPLADFRGDVPGDLDVLAQGVLLDLRR
jgi:hypothetical protein